MPPVNPPRPNAAAIPAQPAVAQTVPVRPAEVQSINKAGAARVTEPARVESTPVEQRSAPLPSFEVRREVNREVHRDFEENRYDEPDPEPVISGPSFLGLNKRVGRPSGFRADDDGRGGRDHLRPSGSVDYLLDEDDEPRRGWGKLIVIVAALALAGGLGYLRWKQGGFDFLKAGDKKPAATQSSGDTAAASSNPDNGSVGQPSSAAAGSATATVPAPTPTAAGTVAQADSAPSSSGTSAGQAATSSQPTAAGAENSPAPAQSTAAQAKPGDSSAPAGATSEDADADSEAPSSDEKKPIQKTVAPKAAARPVARAAVAAKPSAARPLAARTVDSVAEAERYIYGRGVAQDCDQALRILKSAAGHSDSKAMMSLGQLYSAGMCAPRDLPTAYRWYAVALHKEPDNQNLQSDLQRLWSQMTPPERQLAIKLSQ